MSSQLAASVVPEEQQARSGTYTLLGAVLNSPCSEPVVDLLTSIDVTGVSGESLPWNKLQGAIATADLEELKEKAKSHYWGRGVSNDYSIAFKLFMEASKVEDAESLRYLGLMYLTGKGVTKDPVVAINFFERAASKGDTMAAKYLDKIRSISNN